MGSSDPEMIVDQVSNLPATKEPVLASGPFVPPDWFSFLKWELWMILFSAEAILASSTSKFGIEIPRIDDEDIKSSTESTISTSLIHSIASEGNCEQVRTSVLNLILQQANVAGVVNLFEMKIWDLQSLLVCSIILLKIFPH